jgi:hypothetical protein
MTSVFKTIAILRRKLTTTSLTTTTKSDSPESSLSVLDTSLLKVCEGLGVDEQLLLHHLV